MCKSASAGITKIQEARAMLSGGTYTSSFESQIIEKLDEALKKLDPPKLAYIIYGEMGVDQVCETEEDARREVKELRNFDYEADYVICPWDEQDAKIDEMEGRE